MLRNPAGSSEGFVETIMCGFLDVFQDSENNDTLECL